MLNSILTDAFSTDTFLICIVCSLMLGAVIAWVHGLYNSSSKGFVMTIALLPAIVQVVIMLVNGNLGTGVAVMGAFSLVRFRSIPGNAKEISSIFLAMAVGLATGMGYLTAAVLFIVIIGGVSILYNVTSFGEPKYKEKELKITIPEGLDYTGIFDDLFKQYTTKHELIKVKTVNMGSLYKLDYRIRLKYPTEEKVLIDQLRCRNGNLEITCGKVAFGSEEL
ncbi:MAG: DUF4956 domain-containing protein [Lutisporaceae bacterium]